MSRASFTESIVEEAALAWLEGAGWGVRPGADIAPGEPAAERDDYGQVVLVPRLRGALPRLNPALPAEALEDGVLDIFAAAGLDKPDISILSDEFLAEVRGMPQRNLAVELLQKLLKGELKTRRRRNVVQARSFAEMLEQTIRRYQNRAIEAAQVIEELIQLAKEMREASARGEQLGLTEDELAFYDALETNDSAGCSVTTRCAASRASWSRPYATTSPSTGRCARTCARNCACSSSASCASTVTRRTSRRRRRRR